jgi:hypothetical protein
MLSRIDLSNLHTKVYIFSVNIYLMIFIDTQCKSWSQVGGVFLIWIQDIRLDSVIYNYACVCANLQKCFSIEV